MKTRVLLSVIIALGTSAWHTVKAASLDAVKKTGSLRMATEGSFPPFSFYKGKELGGFEVELGTAIAKKMGLKPEWKTFSFDSLLIGLAQDRYDLVISSHGITPERQKAVDFSNPHYCTGGVIVAKEGGPKTEGDLKGKVVSVQVGTTYLEHLKKVPGLKDVKTYPKDTDALQNLLGGRADAWVSDKFAALDAIKKTASTKLQMGDLLFQETIAMAVSKGNSTLKDAVNGALADLMKDGSYAKLSDKYFGQDIRCH